MNAFVCDSLLLLDTFRAERDAQSVAAAHDRRMSDLVLNGPFSIALNAPLSRGSSLASSAGDLALPGTPSGHPDARSMERRLHIRELKAAACAAVSLSVADFSGAQSGTNPFLLWPDACQYGVGAGLFQSQ